MRKYKKYKNRKVQKYKIEKYKNKKGTQKSLDTAIALVYLPFCIEGRQKMA